MSFSFGNKIKVTVFGQSHSEKIGVVIDGLEAGIVIDEARLQKFMARRAPGNDEFSTARKETDTVHFLSGIVDGKTCGAPVCAVIENKDMRSSDYNELKDVFRPSHADFAAWAKFGDSRDEAGGGQFSGRMTAALCIAGGIFIQLLEKKGVYIGAHIDSIAGISDKHFDPVCVTKNDFPSQKAFPVIDDNKGELMKKAIIEAKEEKDSVGGVIECAICGMEAGFGDALFGGIEGKISSAVFAIPAVKGIEFGSGFKGTELLGSQNNDEYEINEDDTVRTKTNNHGGILGGISSGMPIIFRTAIKPTPSIGKPQRSVNISKKENTVLEIKGRHDPCIVGRATPCIEAAAAIAIADMIL